MTFEHKFCCLTKTQQIGELKLEQDSNLITSVFAFFR